VTVRLSRDSSWQVPAGADLANLRCCHGCCQTGMLWREVGSEAMAGPLIYGLGAVGLTL
jgi:hypothetical protein